ncbi:TIGR00282 family metallophosphoesterase [Entomospira entomophila]|uniref:TIGR00282 family metallophosphoesterase n=1 Tax=Entomospira entomophila TaxID=2719988 RepID=A0A968G8X4_9SPIO|nr:TIGR00282 family metallophosphoesterase [Entomospira entomophilus]NIZ40730.1 TIGR00282 family metallophosphoesterase [Entomospira entomophilus]WDI34943.1 TIGR00282 family metallophosphoesterase [Entomospira entomophilus]
MQMKTLMIGDIVGQVGLRRLFYSLPSIQKEYTPDLIIVNGENANEGFGILPDQAQLMFQQGVDVITSGNHIWQQEEVLIPYWQHEKRLLRPENYPDPAPGKGYIVVEKKGQKIAIINLQGRQLMPHIVDNPVIALRALLAQLKKEHVTHIFVDFHAELVTEKEMMAYYFDGKITALAGTHTHTPTLDQKILQNQTAYVSDLGMVGATPSIIGGNIDLSIQKVISQIPYKPEVAESEESILCGLLIFSDSDGKAIKIERILK